MLFAGVHAILSLDPSRSPCGVQPRVYIPRKQSPVVGDEQSWCRNAPRGQQYGLSPVTSRVFECTPPLAIESAVDLSGDPPRKPLVVTAFIGDCRAEPMRVR